MAVVTLKTGPITDRDADPRVKVNSAVMAGTVISAVGTVETNVADSIASKYIMFQIPSNARMVDLKIYSDDVGTAGDTDIGLYDTTEDGGAVVDADFFASALDINAAALTGTDVLHESAVYGFEDSEKTLWEGLGLAEDPNVKYDVVLTLTEALTSISTLTLKALYSI